MNVFLNHVTHYSGSESVPIDLDGFSGDERPTALSLLSDGFRYTKRSSRPVPQMAVDVVARCINESGCRATDIDAIVFCTESFWDDGIEEPTPTPEVIRPRRLRDDWHFKVIATCGATNATPYATWMSSCSNLTTTVEIAAALIHAGVHQRVLVVMAERVPPGRSRLMRNGAAFLSDIAVCCLLSNTGQLRITEIITTTAAGVVKMRKQKNPLLQGREVGVACRELAQKIAHSGKRLAELDILIADNFRSNFYDICLAPLEITRERLWLPTKETYGHAFSADGLLSLELAMLDIKSLKTIGLLNIGPVVLGAIFIENIATRA